ncbi:MAG: hypothetical protein H0W28_04800 [Pyrinomonadaceae bacterium]|jgi:hypothetical protein|nr:hypothetical protein [Pyrinomonadaceae bacterium]MDQ3174854.1 hypothetical protein [Acidobacteriota bacterium]
MNKLFSSLILGAIVFCAGVNASAQGETSKPAPGGNGAAAGPAITATTSPVEMARAAIAAQGGEKFKNLKSVILKGSVDLYAPNSTQSIPGGFVIVIAGDKARMEVDARPAVSFKMIYDGQRSYSSLPNVDMPPMTRFGMGLLVKFDQPGYVVSTLPDKKKQRAFRVSDPDGNTTDFYVDVATGRVMSFLIPYGGYTFGTENKKMKEIDGVLVATSFTQRLEMPQGAFFADYNVKDVKINQPIGDDVFAIP